MVKTKELSNSYLLEKALEYLDLVEETKELIDYNFEPIATLRSSIEALLTKDLEELEKALISLSIEFLATILETTSYNKVILLDLDELGVSRYYSNLEVVRDYLANTKI